jgi:BolA protein
MAHSETQALMHQRLSQALAPIALAIQDDSAQHAGHEGAKGGAGHFTVRITSAVFTGKSRLERHRLVYHPLSDLMPQRIHALAIEALAPEETHSTP